MFELIYPRCTCFLDCLLSQKVKKKHKQVRELPKVNFPGVSLQQLKTDPCLGFECWVQWGSKFSVGLKWVFLSVIYNHRAITANTWLVLCSCLVTNIFNFSWNRWHCFSFVNQFIAKGEGQRKGC